MKRTAAEIKADLIAAHRAKDWKKAAELSQERQQAKKRKICAVCGEPTKGRHCRMHSVRERFWNGRGVKERRGH